MNAKHLLLAAAMTGLAFLGCGSDTSSSTVSWKGVWYNQKDYASRGEFTAALTLSGSSLKGTISLPNHPLGTVEVTGTVTKDYDSSTPPHTYTEINLEDAAKTIKFEGNALEADIANDMPLNAAITIASGDQKLALYNYSGSFGALSVQSVMQTELSSISSVAVSSGGDVYAYGKNGQGTQGVFQLNADGTIAAQVSASCASSLMTWGNDRLWFLSNGNLCEVSTSDFTQFTEHPTTGFSLTRLPFAIAFANQAIWFASGIVTEEVGSMDLNGTVASTISQGLNDCSSIAATDAHLLGLVRSRTGQLQQITLMDWQANISATRYAPVYSASCIAASGDTVAVGTDDGFILRGKF